VQSVHYEPRNLPHHPFNLLTISSAISSQSLAQYPRHLLPINSQSFGNLSIVSLQSAEPELHEKSAEDLSMDGQPIE
jgi:hypothetical protein